MCSFLELFRTRKIRLMESSVGGKLLEARSDAARNKSGDRNLSWWSQNYL
jgi:hypothetical protein